MTEIYVGRMQGTCTIAARNIRNGGKADNERAWIGCGTH